MLYDFALLGAPTEAQTQAIQTALTSHLAPFQLLLGRDVSWTVGTGDFAPDERRTAAALYVGGAGVALPHMASLLSRGIPIIPVASSAGQVAVEIPAELRFLNCIDYQATGPERTTSALLECAGLLPKQRRVFLSYRRDEARAAALQLFDSLSARLFDVFLDTHGVAPGDDFQAVLWHRLCDADVLVMLDTPSYFQSRWTSAEFGRALAKGVAVLRVGWPDASPSARTATASRAELLAEEIDPSSGRLSDDAVDRISAQLEQVRSMSHAARSLNLVSSLRAAVERIGGAVKGVGRRNAVHVQLPDGQGLVVYPSVGVPSSHSLHDAVVDAPNGKAAVLYDHIGLLPTWLQHLDWLTRHVKDGRWLRASEAAWQLAAWEPFPE